MTDARIFVRVSIGYNSLCMTDILFCGRVPVSPKYAAAMHANISTVQVGFGQTLTAFLFQVMMDRVSTMPMGIPSKMKAGSRYKR